MSHLSTLPQELRSQIYHDLSKCDLLNLIKTSRSLHVTTQPHLYQYSVCKLIFNPGHGCYRLPQDSSSSWLSIQNVYLRLHTDYMPQGPYNAAPCPILYNRGQLAPVWWLGGSWPCRNSCGIHLHVRGKDALPYRKSVIVQVLAMLTGFERVRVKIERARTERYGLGATMEDFMQVKKMLMPFWGTKVSYFWRQDGAYLEFLPAEQQREEGFDGGYERWMLAAWQSIWDQRSAGQDV